MVARLQRHRRPMYERRLVQQDQYVCWNAPIVRRNPDRSLFHQRRCSYTLCNIRRVFFMRLNIKKTNTGRGVFAGEAIAKGATIAQMQGKECVWDEVEQLIKKGKVRLDDPFQIGEDDFLLLDRLPLLFNHSCDPNAGITKKRELVALRPILPGEEICYDYSATVCTHSSWVMRCKCGSAVCRKKIGNVLTIPPLVRKTYTVKGLLSAFIRNELK